MPKGKLHKPHNWTEWAAGKDSNPCNTCRKQKQRRREIVGDVVGTVGDVKQKLFEWGVRRRRGICFAKFIEKYALTGNMSMRGICQSGSIIIDSLQEQEQQQKLEQEQQQDICLAKDMQTMA